MARVHKETGWNRNIFRDFYAKVEDGLTVKEFNQFFSKKSFYELIEDTSNVFDNGFFESAIQLLDNSKDNKLSETYLRKGTPAFAAQDFSSALENFNKSIIMARHPSQHETVDTSESSKFLTLSLAYAFRAAVLVELEQYELSLQDIERCLKLGYSKKKNKILICKIKCCVNLKMISLQKEQKLIFVDLRKKPEIEKKIEAIKVEILNEFPEVKLSQDELKAVDQKCIDIIKSFYRVKEAGTVKATRRSKLYSYGLQDYVSKTPPTPDKPHESITGLSALASCIEMPEKGVGIIAIEDIYPGEHLIRIKLNLFIKYVGIFFTK